MTGNRKKSLLLKRVQAALDLSVLAAAFAASYLLRFEFDIPDHELRPALIQLPYVVLIQLGALMLMRVYTFVWRYIGMGEIKAFVWSAVLASVPVLAIRYGLTAQYQEWRVPLSVALMDTVLGFGGVLSLRVLRRALYEKARGRRDVPLRAGGAPVLLIGAGQAGVLAAREIQRRRDTTLRIRGFVDDNPQKWGAIIAGVRVLGNTGDLPRLVRELAIDHVVISLGSASRADLKRILTICEQIPVKVRIIPSLSEILQGKVEVSRIRDLQIEDLLGREPVKLNEGEVEQFLFGKTVMVTGAGGSIGSELARQVARFHPANLLLVERSENVLFEIHRELQRARPEAPLSALLADVGDEMRMRYIFSNYRPEIIIHAAAHKHVPLMENNATEVVKNNIFGTRLLGELAGQFGAEVCVLISTDKAVRPTSLMGASKRVAELVIQDLDQKYRTRYVAVRFGNVIGSTGSVIPIFREQIRKGGPVTVTHPDMFRYFMTIPEASQLVLQASAIGEGGEVFILDMGDPIRILDLARDAIVLSGLKPDEDIDIVFTGMRPGEKLFEELEIKEENMKRTRHPKIFIGTISAYPPEEVRHALNTLKPLAEYHEEEGIRRFLNSFLPEACVQVGQDQIVRSGSQIALEPAKRIQTVKGAVA